MSSDTQKAAIVLLSIVVIAAAGTLIVRQLSAETFRPRAAWRTDSLHIYSAKDGPWVVTHLIKLPSGTNEYAVAQLPSPATIIDSRGEHFTSNFLQSLTWITHSGSTAAPPVIGHPMKAFYLVPQETK
jgi:hypothetical protein